MFEIIIGVIGLASFVTMGIAVRFDIDVPIPAVVRRTHIPSLIGAIAYAAVSVLHQVLGGFNLAMLPLLLFGAIFTWHLWILTRGAKHAYNAESESQTFSRAAHVSLYWATVSGVLSWAVQLFMSTTR